MVFFFLVVAAQGIRAAGASLVDEQDLMAFAQRINPRLHRSIILRGGATGAAIEEGHQIGTGLVGVGAQDRHFENNLPPIWRAPIFWNAKIVAVRTDCWQTVVNPIANRTGMKCQASNMQDVGFCRAGRHSCTSSCPWMVMPVLSETVPPGALIVPTDRLLRRLPV